jgi:hypothetical protein
MWRGISVETGTGGFVWGRAPRPSRPARSAAACPSCALAPRHDSGQHRSAKIRWRSALAISTRQEEGL